MRDRNGPGALAGAAGRRGISLSGGKLATAGNTWLYWDGTGPPDPNRKRRPGQEAALLRLSGNKNNAIHQNGANIVIGQYVSPKKKYSASERRPPTTLCKNTKNHQRNAIEE